jgi:hypothetical protein
LQSRERHTPGVPGHAFAGAAQIAFIAGYYFLTPAAPVGFPLGIEAEVAAGFGFSALGFFGSRLLLFCPLAMATSLLGRGIKPYVTPHPLNNFRRPPLSGVCGAPLRAAPRKGGETFGRIPYHAVSLGALAMFRMHLGNRTSTCSRKVCWSPLRARTQSAFLSTICLAVSL